MLDHACNNGWVKCPALQIYREVLVEIEKAKIQHKLIKLEVDPFLQNSKVSKTLSSISFFLLQHPKIVQKVITVLDF